MRSNHSRNQGNLFEQSSLELLKIQVKELDKQISTALKRSDFSKAKQLTDKQALLLNQLLEFGDTPATDKTMR